MNSDPRNVQIDMILDPATEKKYLRIPFEVLPGTAKLKIEYSYLRYRVNHSDPNKSYGHEVNIIDLALEDWQQHLVGASGSERSQIVIHENYATDGYRPAALTPGTWYIILGMYKIEPEGCPLNIHIELEAKQTVLLKGDTHLHTTHSDGWYTVEQVISRARQDRLDYIILTDHNSMTSNEHLVSDDRLVVIPGVEMTYYNGHYNLLGQRRPVNSFFAIDKSEVLAIMQEGRHNKALASINHPFDDSCGWLFGFDAAVETDLLEVWNGPFTPQNAKAVAYWHQQLVDGRRRPIIGDSDNHRSDQFRLMGNPTTFVYADSRCQSDILAAMQAGHAFIGSTPNAPEIELSAGPAQMGDILSKDEADSICLKANSLRPHDEIRIITDTGIMHRQQTDTEYSCRIELPLSDARFYRVEIWRPIPGFAESLVSISNPVYVESEVGSVV